MQGGIILLSLAISVACFEILDPSKQPRYVHRYEQEGHRTYVEIDTVNSLPVFSKIYAVTYGDDGLLFSKGPEFDKDNKGNPCVTFAAPNSGTHKQCNHYMVVHQDYLRLRKVSWKEYKITSSCPGGGTALGLEQQGKKFRFIAVLIKSDLTKQDSPKYVGGYDPTTDEIFYLRDKTVASIDDVSKLAPEDYNLDQKVEILCWEEYDYTNTLAGKA